MKKPSFDHAGVRVDKYVYISGGGDGGVLTNATHRISWENPVKWESCGQMKTERIDHSLVNIGTKIYCFGGGTLVTNTDTTIEFKAVSSVEEYDISSQKWNVLTLLKRFDTIPFKPASHMFAQSFSDKEILVWGGINADLKTSVTKSYISDIQEKTFKATKQEVKNDKSRPTDFIDLNSGKVNNTLCYLGPYKGQATVLASTANFFNLNDHKTESKKISHQMSKTTGIMLPSKDPR